MSNIRVGGQAVLEGVMMRSPHGMAIAVRRPDGTIATKSEKIDSFFLRTKPFTWFPLRGVVSLIEMFLLGLKALSYSATEATGEEEDFGGKEIAFSFSLAMIFVVLLFVLLPAYLTGFAKTYIADGFWKSLAEGVMRISFFLIYVVAVSRMKDIKRVFEYHGAEHKAVHAYEHGLELTTENVKDFSPLHVGCGTGYLVSVMIIAVLVFAFIPKTTLLIRIAIQLVLVPVIASVTYEMIRVARKYERYTITKILMAPGLWLQKLTAREPDASQIEIAVTALKEALKMEETAKTAVS